MGGPGGWISSEGQVDVSRDSTIDKMQRSLPPSMRGDSSSPPPPPPPALPNELEALKSAICKLRGVRQVRIRPGREEVKVSLAVLPERCEADTIAEVERLAAETGAITSVLQVEVLGAGDRTRALPRRRLASLSTRRFAHRFTAQVTLELMGDALVGEVDVPAGPRFEHRSIARAVLESVRRLLPYPLQLENVDVLGFGSERVAVVSVGHGAGLLVGSALVRSDEYDAVARATLDAINRVIDPSLQG